MSRPVRMCAGCRGRENKADLLRIVAREGIGVVDPAQTEPGRGVYLHPNRDCLDRAVKRRSIGRSLRAEIDGPRTAEMIGLQLDSVT
ncbi:MAG TPA: YlxR family protein [Propionibacteriaceae bacterium]|nr:YlxR family protein [Propionibacteriaceae bacterium]